MNYFILKLEGEHNVDDKALTLFSMFSPAENKTTVKVFAVNKHCESAIRYMYGDDILELTYISK